MSRPHSRSPMYTHRVPTSHRRRDGGPYGDHHNSAGDADPRRITGDANRMGDASHWSNDRRQGEEQVDHWAKFIEVLGYAERRRLSPKSRGYTEDESKTSAERPPHSAWQLPRERLPSPNLSHYKKEYNHRKPSPDWRREKYGVAPSERHEDNSGWNHKGSRGSSPRSHHSQRRREDRMEHRYCNDQYKDKYQERRPFAERSHPKKSDFWEHHQPSKRSRVYDYLEEDHGSQRSFSRSPVRAPLIVEHDHGISHHSATGRNHSAEGRDSHRNEGSSQDQHRGGPGHAERRDASTSVSSGGRQSPARARMRHTEPSGLDVHPRNFQAHRAMDSNQDVDLRKDRHSRTGEATPTWRENQMGGKFGGNGGPEKVRQRSPYHRNPNNSAASAPGEDLSEHETLKIKVDMNRPEGQSSSFNYSSDRQLSLDLVHVGRQRLDFLPMLEHSGTYRETPMHSGTFAQEIITLVHQVKEIYFRGQGMTLNERFANVQSVNLDENLEEPTVNRHTNMASDTQQIICKIGHIQPPRRQLIPDPDDLRHDLERKRLQRLEGVKVTIAGGVYPPIPESVENESAYMRDEEASDDWAEQGTGRSGQWDGALQRNRQNFAGPHNFNRSNNRPVAHRRQNRNNASGANW